MKRLAIVGLVALGLVQNSRAASLLWSPVTDGNWDLVTANWLNQTLSTMVPFAQGDSVTFDNSGLSYPTVDLGANTLSPSSVVVDTDGQYIFTTSSTGKLNNVGTLSKKGYGTLVMDNNAVITNWVSIELGTLQLGSGAGRGTLGSGFAGFTATITNNGTLVYNRTGTFDMTNNLAGSGTISVLSTATGTWNLYGNNSMSGYSLVHNANMPIYFRTGTSLGTLGSIQSSPNGANVRIQFAGGVSIGAGCPISATLAYGANSTRFSLMSMAGVNTVSGPITLAGGGWSDPNSKPQVNLYAQNAGTELNVFSSVSESDPTGNPYLGDFFLRGSGAFGRMYGTINLPQGVFQKLEACTWTLYSTGNKAIENSFSNGRLNMGVAYALPMAKTSVVSPGILDLAGYDQAIGDLWGSGLITNSSVAADAMLTITNGGGFTGTIADNGTTKISFRYINPGLPVTQQLVGNNNYHGATILDIATAIALGNTGLPYSTPIDMGNGSSIDLSTKSDHTFTLAAAQTLKGDGTVHVNGNLINQGTISLKASKSGGIVTSDLLTIDGGYTVTYGGTLELTLSGDTLNASDTLKLFQGVYSGSFSTINPNVPAAGFAWDTSTLATDGTLRIVASIPTTGTNITCTVVSGGTQLQLSWPPAYTGWIVQGQTNAAGVGLTANWHDVPGSDSVNQLLVPISSANGSVFYRMIYRP